MRTKPAGQSQCAFRSLVGTNARIQQAEAAWATLTPRAEVRHGHRDATRVVCGDPELVRVLHTAGQGARS
jgi:hypothetical protein